jgi:hypothetical protein
MSGWSHHVDAVRAKRFPEEPMEMVSWYFHKLGQKMHFVKTPSTINKRNFIDRHRRAREDRDLISIKSVLLFDVASTPRPKQICWKITAMSCATSPTPEVRHPKLVDKAMNYFDISAIHHIYTSYSYDVMCVGL